MVSMLDVDKANTLLKEMYLHTTSHNASLGRVDNWYKSLASENSELWQINKTIQALDKKVLHLKRLNRRQPLPYMQSTCGHKITELSRAKTALRDARKKKVELLGCRQTSLRGLRQAKLHNISQRIKLRRTMDRTLSYLKKNRQEEISEE